MEKLTSLQKCINDAQLEPRRSPLEAMENRNFRAHPEVIARADEILKNHGVSLSAFVRKCCENLVKDYRDAQG